MFFKIAEQSINIKKEETWPLKIMVNYIKPYVCLQLDWKEGRLFYTCLQVVKINTVGCIGRSTGSR